MFALAPSPLPPGQTIIHKYSVQCAPYNATGLLIFPMLATSLGARFGGCELFAVCSHRYRYIRRQCDGNGNDNGNGNSSDDTYRHIAVAVIAVSLLPAPATPLRPLCVFINNACSAFASASASASAVALPIRSFVCSLVRLLLRTSTCFRCEPLPLPLPLSLPLAHWLWLYSGSGCGLSRARYSYVCTARLAGNGHTSEFLETGRIPLYATPGLHGLM